MTRIFFHTPLSEGAALSLPESAFRHLVQVLRMREGETFTAFDGRGGEYDAVLVEVGKRSASARLLAHHDISRESPLDLTLAQCISKGERMDYTLQKAVELGVTRIVPLISGRSVVRLDEDRWEKKLEHWRGVVVSACEQSGRTQVPALASVQALTSWLDNEDAHGDRLTLDPQARHSLRDLPRRHGPVTLLAGPEGGLSDGEIDRARRAGFIGIRIGPRVLRTETAGVAALAALQALWGDWSKLRRSGSAHGSAAPQAPQSVPRSVVRTLGMRTAARPLTTARTEASTNSNRSIAVRLRTSRLTVTRPWWGSSSSVALFIRLHSSPPCRQPVQSLFPARGRKPRLHLWISLRTRR